MIVIDAWSILIYMPFFILIYLLYQGLWVIPIILYEIAKYIRFSFRKFMMDESLNLETKE